MSPIPRLNRLSRIWIEPLAIIDCTTVSLHKARLFYQLSTHIRKYGDVFCKLGLPIIPGKNPPYPLS